MDINKFKKKLERYLNGTANETEGAIVEAWYTSYQSSEDTDINSSKEAVKKAIRQKIKSATTAQVIKFQWLRYSIAASVLITAGLAIFVYHAKKPLPPQDTYTTLQTKAGEVKQILLPDSSMMWVNSLSRVRIPSSFNGKIRNILLDDGEVFLKVKHNVAKPFRVNTHGLQVQVLGTSFNVKAYNSIKRISIAVATGKVAVSAAGKRLSFLTPGQQLVFDDLTKTFKQSNIDVSATQGWKDGETYLTQAGFDELSLVMKNLFDIKLKAANKAVSKYQFTLRLKRNMPANEALRMISLIHNTHFRREGDEVVLY